MFATKRLRLAVAALAATALGGGAAVAATAASASPAHHYPPVSLNRLNLSGFVVNAKYTLGTNTGNTFQQVYGNGTVQGTPIAGPNVGVKFPPRTTSPSRLATTRSTSPGRTRRRSRSSTSSS